jgi:uncharacterized protein (DUF927 family)
MAVFKLKIKETTEYRLQRAINLGREEALKEVLEWLDENFYTSDIEFADSYLPEYVLNGNFESKEQMLQSFKERFNIVDDCDQQYPSDFINDR